MSELHYIYSRDQHMTTRGLFHTYGNSLPLLFVVRNGYIYQEDIDFPSGQVLLIFSIGYQDRALVHDAKGRTLYIPVDYRHRFNVLSRNKDKDVTLRQIVDNYSLPVHVEISNLENVYFTDNNAASFRLLSVMGVHRHPYLKAVVVKRGTISSCVFPVPLYLKGVTFCRVTGLDTGNKAEDSTRALQTLMARLTAQLNFSQECGDKEIIMLSKELINDMTNFYEKITENIYIRIGLKNSNEPKYKHMIPQRRLPPIPTGELEAEGPKRPPRPPKLKTTIEKRELPPIPSLSGENSEKSNRESFYECPPADYDVEIVPTDLFRKETPISGFPQGHSSAGRPHRVSSQTDFRGEETVSPFSLQNQSKFQDLSRGNIDTSQVSGAIKPNANFPSDRLLLELKEKLKPDTLSSSRSNMAPSKSTNQNEKGMARVKPMRPELTTRHSSPALIPLHHNPAPGLEKMTMNDVSELLHRLFLEKHERHFRDNLVDGVILSKITDEVLCHGFGLSELETLRLRTFIETGHIPK